MARYAWALGHTEQLYLSLVQQSQIVGTFIGFNLWAPFSLQTVAKGLKRLRKEKTAFEAMTELADKLLNNGDYGIYSISKEDLEDAVDAVRRWSC
eukprot:SAG31_NODE_639_length_13309_cov_4.008468_5_plen_95_part_00